MDKQITIKLFKREQNLDKQGKNDIENKKAGRIKLDKASDR